MIAIIAVKSERDVNWPVAHAQIALAILSIVVQFASGLVSEII